MPEQTFKVGNDLLVDELFQKLQLYALLAPILLEVLVLSEEL